MNVILCGMPGSGKSYLGALVAEKMGRIFVDTDTLVMAEYCKRHQRQVSCREIRVEGGDELFRVLESEIILSLEGVQEMVIATGGGVLLSKNNIPMLKSLGTLFYLKASPKLLLERLKNRKYLPSFLNPKDIEGSFTALMEQRLHKYEQYCDFCIDVEEEPVLEIIENLYRKRFPHGK